MNDNIKIIQSLAESGLLIKGVIETIENEAKKQKGGFLGMFFYYYYYYYYYHYYY